MSVRDTSIEAYEWLKENGKIPPLDRRVLASIPAGGATRNEIAKISGVALCSLCGAVTRLVKVGAAYDDERRECRVTGFQAHVVKSNAKQPEQMPLL